MLAASQDNVPTVRRALPAQSHCGGTFVTRLAQFNRLGPHLRFALETMLRTGLVESWVCEAKCAHGAKRLRAPAHEVIEATRCTSGVPLLRVFVQLLPVFIKRSRSKAGHALRPRTLVESGFK